MAHIPNLPSQGPLRTFVVFASIASVAFVVDLVLVLVKRRWQESRWALAPVLLLAIAIPLGTIAGSLHALMSLGAAAVGVRNAVVFRDLPRWFALVGSVSLLISMVLARRMFG